MDDQCQADFTEGLFYSIILRQAQDDKEILMTGWDNIKKQTGSGKTPFNH